MAGVDNFSLRRGSASSKARRKVWWLLLVQLRWNKFGP